MALILDPVAEKGAKGRVEPTRGNSVPEEIILRMQENQGFTCTLVYLLDKLKTGSEGNCPDSLSAFQLDAFHTSLFIWGEGATSLLAASLALEFEPR